MVTMGAGPGAHCAHVITQLLPDSGVASRARRRPGPEAPAAGALPVLRAISAAVPLAIIGRLAIEYSALALGTRRHANFAIGVLTLILCTLAGYIAAPDRKLSRGATSGAVAALFALIINVSVSKAFGIGGEQASWSTAPVFILGIAGIGALLGQSGARLRKRHVHDNTPSASDGRPILFADQVLTARQVSSDYDSSILVRRWAGAWLDFVAVAGILIAPYEFLGKDLYQRTFLIWLVLGVLYFPVLEGVKGWSLGKLATGTRVVDRHGRVPGVGKAAIRTVARLFEVNPLFAGGLPAGIAVLVSKGHQRVGDMMADTYVLKKI